ncbi:helix-turn-helix domain-containing protein, partial [Acinetobacter baumannii]|nr:helix-turn-helix domain-containing protein [Acinetobacter baumannii]
FIAINKTREKIFITSADEVFGFMLCLIRKKLTLTQEEMGLIIGGEQFQYSKTGYAKLERGETSINIQIIFNLSQLLACNHIDLFLLYDSIIHSLSNSQHFTVQFDPMIGIYGMGKYSSTTLAKIEKRKGEHRFKIFCDNIGDNNIKLINNILSPIEDNPYIAKTIRLMVERARNKKYMRKYKNT